MSKKSTLLVFILVSVCWHYITRFTYLNHSKEVETAFYWYISNFFSLFCNSLKSQIVPPKLSSYHSGPSAPATSDFPLNFFFHFSKTMRLPFDCVMLTTVSYAQNPYDRLFIPLSLYFLSWQAELARWSRRPKHSRHGPTGSRRPPRPDPSSTLPIPPAGRSRWNSRTAASVDKRRRYPWSSHFTKSQQLPSRSFAPKQLPHHPADVRSEQYGA